MSAMKMEFICKESPEVQPASAPRVVGEDEHEHEHLDATRGNEREQENENTKGKLSALLNNGENDREDEEDTGDSDVEMSEIELPPSKMAARSEDAELELDPAEGDDDADPVDISQVPVGSERNAMVPPAKKAKIAFVETTATASVTDQSTGHTDGDGNALSDNENSEDEQVEYAPWEEIDLNPAVDLVNKLVRESLEAGKTYNKSITAKTSQLIAGCDNVLLELKNLSDAREVSRKQASKQQGQQDGDCSCGIAMSMLPLTVKADVAGAAQTAAQPSKRVVQVDEITEDQTSRALFKIEASMERLRELAELIQATSMQGEANLVAKVTLHDGAIRELHTAVQASAAAATAAAIAQERGRSASSVFAGRLYSPLQVKKLQEWYYSYPRPLTDELTLMRTILNYRPYVNPFHPGGLTIAQVREWFKRRRYRERVRYVKLAVEAGRDAVAAEEEIDLRIEQRIEHLRAVVDPNELVKDLDKVRAESSMYDAVIDSFSRTDALDSYISASHGIPAVGEHSSTYGGRSKRPRTQDADVDDAVVVKTGTHNEISVLQKRIRTLLSGSRSATNTNALQQVIDLLRSMDISKDTRIQTGVVADLKMILKSYRKPTLLRKSTITLLESLGMTRRVIMDQNAHDEEPPKVPTPPPPTTETIVQNQEETVTTEYPEPSIPIQKTRKKKIQRPMKFSMRQVRALEEWFQERYKPSQSELEGYIVALNNPPLREPNQTSDVNLTQLRRWFNKRRCLRRPPFALMTQQDAEKAGMMDIGDESKFMGGPDDPIGASNGVDIDPNDLTIIESGENSQDDSSEDDDSSDDDE